MPRVKFRGKTFQSWGLLAENTGSKWGLDQLCMVCTLCKTPQTSSLLSQL